MIKKMDIVELIGRALKVPDEGFTFKKGVERINIFPATTKDRIFNHSKNESFYLFAAEFGTYIIPFIFGIKELLQSNDFKQVSDVQLPVKLDSEYIPLGNTKVRSKWYHMFNIIGQYNAITAHDLLAHESKLKILSFFKTSNKIPFCGIYDPKGCKMFYPMASIKFPYIDREKLGKFNFDYDNRKLLVYAGDGNTYLISTESLTPMIDALKDAGYILKEDLYIPSN